jgi:homoserine kinase
MSNLQAFKNSIWFLILPIIKVSTFDCRKVVEVKLTLPELVINSLMKREEMKRMTKEPSYTVGGNVN